MIIIGLGHKAQQGKDTFANAILSQYRSSLGYSFARELKLYCRDHHQELVEKYPFIHLDRKEDPIYGYTRMLQYYGTDIVRAQDPNHWIRKVEERINKDNPDIAVVTDVRFPNEAAWVKSKKGLLIDVMRLTLDGKQYIDTTRNTKHPSEISLDGYSFDAVIGVLDGKVDLLQSLAIQVVNNELMKEAEAATVVMEEQEEHGQSSNT